MRTKRPGIPKKIRPGPITRAGLKVVSKEKPEIAPNWLQRFIASLLLRIRGRG